MSSDLITRLRALDEKMTPGPWESGSDESIVAADGMAVCWASMDDAVSWANGHEDSTALATLRNIWPLVVDALEAHANARVAPILGVR